MSNLCDKNINTYRERQCYVTHALVDGRGLVQILTYRFEFVLAAFHLARACDVTVAFSMGVYIFDSTLGISSTQTLLFHKV